MSTLKKKNEIITSKRTFGIEIECGNKDIEAFEYIHEKHHGWLRIIRDSSITLDNGKELVTKILKGKNGADKIIGLCKDLTELNFITDDVSCGLHLHLDGTEFQNKEDIVVVDKDIDGLIKDRKGDVQKVFFVDKHCVARHGNGDVEKPRPFIEFISQVHNNISTKSVQKLSTFTEDPMYAVSDGDGKGFTSHSISTVDRFDEAIAKLVKDKKINALGKKLGKEMVVLGDSLYTDGCDKAKESFRKKIKSMFKVKDGKHVVVLSGRKYLERIKTLMYFYVAFNDIVQGMVAPSRKAGNAYCMPISDFFDLDQIENTGSYNDFEKMWYKVEEIDSVSSCKSNHYNDSRYLDVNFHCLWNRTGTIELRLHGSTKDTNQILLWTAFHQLIVDKIASDELKLSDIKDVIDGCTTLESKYLAMQDCLGMPEHLQKYVIRLLNHFSNLNIT